MERKGDSCPFCDFDYMECDGGITGVGVEVKYCPNCDGEVHEFSNGRKFKVIGGSVSGVYDGA